MTTTRIELEHVVPAGDRYDAELLARLLHRLGRYGTGNRNTEGLRLSACRLAFRCPFTGARREFSLDAAGSGAPEAGAAPGPEQPA